MAAVYDAAFRDAYGEERTTIANDGHLLTMRLRGVEFAGTSFDFLEPLATSGTTDPLLARFDLYGGCLCAYLLSWAMPIPVVAGAEILEAMLHAQLDLGEPRPGGNKGLEHERLTLSLEVGGMIVAISQGDGFFESTLGEIQAALPDGMYLKSCFTCAFSEYHPVGQGLFGDMACFRDTKEAYRHVIGKSALFDLWDARAGDVQETYLCPEFERRAPNTGYRG